MIYRQWRYRITRSSQTHSKFAHITMPWRRRRIYPKTSGDSDQAMSSQAVGFTLLFFTQHISQRPPPVLPFFRERPYTHQFCLLSISDIDRRHFRPHSERRSSSRIYIFFDSPTVVI